LQSTKKTRRSISSKKEREIHELKARNHEIDKKYSELELKYKDCFRELDSLKSILEEIIIDFSLLSKTTTTLSIDSVLTVTDFVKLIVNGNDKIKDIKFFNKNPGLNYISFCNTCFTNNTHRDGS